MKRLVLRALTLATMLSVAACAHTKIPNTSIDDTETNRAILKVMEGFHRAVEARDRDSLVLLLSPRYYEDNGNVDSSDDYDVQGLRTGLAQDFERTKRIQLNMKVEDIQVSDDEATAYAFVLYTMRAQSEFPSGPKWKTASDRARVELEKRNNRWLIVSGI